VRILDDEVFLLSPDEKHVDINAQTFSSLSEEEEEVGVSLLQDFGACSSTSNESADVASDDGCMESG